MKKGKVRIGRKTCYHIVGWAVFIFYEVSLVKMVRSAAGVADSPWVYVLPYAFNILLFYSHEKIVLPFSFEKTRKKTILIILVTSIELAVYLLLMGLVQDQNSNTPFLIFYPTKIAFVKQLWRGIYFLIFSTAFWLIERSFDRIKRLKEVERNALLYEREKQALQLRLVTAQNAYLQAQINPHLLFNTLNFIHSEVLDVAPQASEAIVTLSEMMRYLLVENEEDGKVELQKEIQQIENLIKINQCRFHHKLYLCLYKSGDFDKVRIIPLLLVPFVENVFKYADLRDAQYPAEIKVTLNHLELKFSTFNRKHNTKLFPSRGIGIANVNTRLQSGYPERFSLHIDESGDTYFLNLTIKL